MYDGLLYWGVDSASPAPQVLPTVVERLGRRPAFCGRYIGGAFSLTAAEIAELQSDMLALQIIYNALGAQDVCQGYSWGYQHGNNAVRAAQALSIPTGVALYVDIESDWQPTGEFLHGYTQAVADFAYTPGVYLNADQPASAQAYAAMRAAYTDPVLLYASEPELAAWVDTVRIAFTPLAPYGLEADACVHQYAENCLGGLVDLNVATQLGWAHMYQPTPPPPPVIRAIRHGGLKRQPNNTCPDAIGPRHEPVVLAAGQIVLPTGKTANGYTELRLPNSPVHGYFPTAYLQAA